MEPQPTITTTHTEVKVRVLTTIACIFGIAAIAASVKGWMMFILTPLATVSLIASLIFVQIYRAKQQKGTLYPGAWPTLIGYTVSFFLTCFCAPMVGDAYQSSAFTFIAVDDTRTSTLYNISGQISAVAFLAACVLAVAVVVFAVLKRRKAKV